MYSIDLIQIPDGWAAHCSSRKLGVSSAGRTEAFFSLKNKLLDENPEENPDVYSFELTDPGYFLFQKFTNS